MDSNGNGLSPHTLSRIRRGITCRLIRHPFKIFIQIICPRPSGSRGAVSTGIGNSELSRLVQAVSTSTLSFVRPLTMLQRKIFVLGTRCMALIDGDVPTAHIVIESSTAIVREAANMSIAPCE